MQEKHSGALVRASVGSLSRVATIRTEVITGLRSSPVRESVERVVKPKSPAGGMKRVGAVLVASPDPFTDVPAVALLVSSYVLKRREPASLTHLALETKKLMREFQSLRL